MEDNLQQQISRSWLESLSTGELIRAADTYGIDIPAGLERIFIIEEILESANQDEEQEAKEEIAVNPSYSEAVLLPKQYNISYVEVIIRDPLWAFVFWEIKSHDREQHENAADFNGYCLRVIPMDTESEETDKKAKKKDNSFTVSVGAQDSARYLGFAEHPPKKASRYVIKLNVLRGDKELLIASSFPFDLPRLYEKEDIIRLNKNPLIRLSGIQDLSIIKNSVRQPRVKRK